MTTRNITAFALLMLTPAAFLAPGCGASYELVTKSRVEGASSKPYLLKNYIIEIAETPSGANPEITVKVQRQRFWIETAKGVKQQYRQYSDGKLEIEPGKRQEKDLARITGKTEWTPAANETVMFSVPLSGRSASAVTDDSGIARFSVVDYAEEWIEGRDVDVEVRASLFALSDPQTWEKAENKHPNEAKDLLKVEARDFQETVTVRARVLQSIFERK